MACKFCGAEPTNTGYLRHYGKYTGFKCRTYYGEGILHRGMDCIKEEIIRTAIARMKSESGGFLFNEEEKR